MILALAHAEAGEWEWLSSEVVDYEIAQIPDVARRLRVAALASSAHRTVELTDAVTRRAHEIEELGFHPMDALHLACAEAGRADVFLTTDDRLLRRARRRVALPHMRVANPLAWLQEQTDR